MFIFYVLPYGAVSANLEDAPECNVTSTGHLHLGYRGTANLATTGHMCHKRTVISGLIPNPRLGGAE